jgi:hypothetical protein
MESSQKSIWTGKSGVPYTYFVYPLPASFKLGQVGNYIFARLEHQNWIPIYIGEGDLREKTSDSHHQAECISSRGATHVHAHLNPWTSDRSFEERDLLANYPGTYKPDGCNETTRG